VILRIKLEQRKITPVSLVSYLYLWHNWRQEEY